MKRTIIFLGMVFCMTLQDHAQGHKGNDAFDEWRRSIHEDFDNFREQIIADYAEFMRNPWKEMEEQKPIPAPKDDTTPPVVRPKDEAPQPVEDKPIKIEEVVSPVIKTEPQPQPVAPIQEVPVATEKFVDFKFFGTNARVRFDVADVVRLSSVNPAVIADAVEAMSRGSHDNMILDCLALRQKHKLNDWAYLQLLKCVADAICGSNTNEAELLMAYLYMQSGYKMRLAQDGTHLYMLYSSKHTVLEKCGYVLDGENYYGVNDLPSRLYICPAAYPKEKSMSLYFTNSMELDERMSDVRTIKSERYPAAVVNVSVNKNLVDFYDTYPTSVLGEDFCTRWAMYANTPMDRVSAAMLYPQLKSVIEGKSQLEAANILLNWVQTGFVYEFDNKVWGHDRAFFSEESLFYPYCDCEDRSILYTRLVRDLLGLKCILIYYPGHLACAVNFTESVAGDYIELKGRRFVVTDPTYIRASVGQTMPEMNNASAKVILLQ